MSNPASAFATAFSFDEPPPLTARRLLEDQLDSAIGVMGAFETDRGRAIHEFRKHGKRIRGLVRLLRPAWPKAAYRSWNETLRHAASRFSGARDSYVWLETMRYLRERPEGSPDGIDWEALHGALVRRREAEWPAERLDRHAAEALEDVCALRGRVEEEDFTRVTWNSLVEGVARGYRRGEIEYLLARETGSPEHLHQWRKRAKYGSFHLALIRQLAPGEMDRRSELASRLGSLLGIHHDLAVLENLLLGGGAGPAEMPGSGVLAAHAGEVRRGLDEEAFALGAELYDEDPDAFRKRLKGLVPR